MRCNRLIGFLFVDLQIESELIFRDHRVLGVQGKGDLRKYLSMQINSTVESG